MTTYLAAPTPHPTPTRPPLRVKFQFPHRTDPHRWNIGDGAVWATHHTGWLIAAGVTVFLAALIIDDHRRTKTGSKKGGKGAGTKRSRMPKGAEGKLVRTLGPVLGWGTDATKFVDMPRKPDLPGAVIAFRYADTHIMKPAGIDTCRGQIESLWGGEWVNTTSRTDHQQDRLKFTRQAEPWAWPTAVRYTDLLPARPGQIPLGILEGGTVLAWDLTNPVYAHGLIAGTTGAGKSNALREAVAGFASANILIDILDAKGGEDFEDFAGHPGIRVWTEPADMMRILIGYRDDMKARQKTRGKERDALPRRVLIIDEAAEVLTAIRLHFGDVDMYVGLLITIAQLARSVKLHLLLATQKPSGKALTGDPTTGVALRDLLGFKVSLGYMSGSAARMIFDDQPPVVEKIVGRGVILDGGRFVGVQTARLDIAEAVELARKGTAGFPPEQLTIEPAEPAEPGYDPEPAPTPDPDEQAPVAAPVQVECRHPDCGQIIITRSTSVAKCPRCGKRTRIPAATLAARTAALDVV
jgi:hypothetical protein